MAKYSSSTLEGKCIFCEIATGKIKPLGKSTFWENKDYMAWLSPFPNTDGFTIIIPKKHYQSDVLQLPDEILSEFVLEAKKISQVLLKYYKDVGRIGLIMEGTGIDHAHIKLIPMHGTEHMKKGKWKQYLSNNSNFFKKYEGYIASNDGPKADYEKLELAAKKLKKLL